MKILALLLSALVLVALVGLGAEAQSRGARLNQRGSGSTSGRQINLDGVLGATNDFISETFPFGPFWSIKIAQNRTPRDWGSPLSKLRALSRFMSREVPKRGSTSSTASSASSKRCPHSTAAVTQLVFIDTHVQQQTNLRKKQFFAASSKAIEFRLSQKLTSYTFKALLLHSPWGQLINVRWKNSIFRE